MIGRPDSTAPHIHYMWSMLTLYGEPSWDSPFVYSAFVAMREKGLPFDVVAVDLGAGEHRRPPFSDRSLTAKVPALDHDGFWLSESVAIVEYLEERFPAPEYAPVLPTSIEGRARARQIFGWLRSGIQQLRAERPTSGVFGHPSPAEPLGAQARSEADRLIRVAETLLPDGADALFGRWTIADAELVLALRRLIAAADPVPPRLRAYADATWARPSVRAYAELGRPPRS